VRAAPASIRVHWSHDGARVAIAKSGEVRIFDVRAGDSRRIPTPGEARHLVWSPDDAELATVSVTNDVDYEFELWDTATSSQLTKQPARDGMAPVFTANGAFVAFTGRLEGAEKRYPHRPTLALFDTRKRTSVEAITVDPPPDDGTPKSWVWDQTGEPQPVQVALDAMPRWIAVRWDRDAPLALVRLDDHRRVARVARGATYGGVVVSVDTRWVLWGEGDGVERWDLVLGKPGQRLSLPHGERATALGVHPRRPELLVLTDHVVVSLWDLTTARRLWETPLQTKEAAEVAGYVDEKDMRLTFFPGEDKVTVEHEYRYLLDSRTGRVIERGDRHAPSHVNRHPGDPPVEITLREHSTDWSGIRVFAKDLATGEERALDSEYRAHAIAEASNDARRVVVVDPDTGEVVWFGLEKRERHVLCPAGAR
jgi:hypothetical protein